jgi:hypothetical protein
MFAVAGVGLALYTLYAAVRGRVWSKSGANARAISRDIAPDQFWIAIAIYAGLSLALMFFF